MNTEITIFGGGREIAEFWTMEDAVKCLPAIARILKIHCTLEAHPVERVLEIPKGVYIDDQFDTRWMAHGRDMATRVFHSRP